MTLAIHRLIHSDDRSTGAIDGFLREHAFPLVEGASVTFVYRGAADRVRLRHWVFGLESSLDLQRLDGTDLWHLTLDLPGESRIEYKYVVHAHGHDHWIRDPRNPHTARDPYGANSVLSTEGYERPDWTHPDAEARKGVVAEHWLQDTVFGGGRRIHVYTPARFRPSRTYPLLVVHDGIDFLNFAVMKQVLDNLIHRLEIPPMIVAFTQSDNRLHEYAADEQHARFIVENVLPFVEHEYPISDRLIDRGLMGASFGAVATLYTAWRHQGVFGNLLLLSGSFAFTDIGQHKRGEAFDPIVPFVNAFRDEPGRPAEKLYVACGVYESLIYENRSLASLLQNSRMVVRYVEARDGHNWENWRDRLREGLSWLFPGPMWMVYE